MSTPQLGPETATRRKLEALFDQSKGRSLQEIIQSSDPLKGVEAQRLRTYFSSICMEPTRDLDAYGTWLVNGELDKLKAHFEQRKNSVMVSANSHVMALNYLFSMRWGPTQTPIFNCLLCATMIWPDRREKLLDVVRWLIAIGVPVDGKDLSGTTALSHSLSTRPAFDPEFAQMLIDAGGDINARNRYGATCAHEFSMVWSPDPTAIARASQALQCFLSNGGDPNIAENDGITALTAMRVPWLSGLKKMALKEEERRRKEGYAEGAKKSGTAPRLKGVNEHTGRHTNEVRPILR
ncbi:hypothetical protein JB92DRAFT_2834542 [Gautieria morchelliformis]|nr:hypothetical protein JB92DRAFT_2834542 [Gautieria morchelliformis]